MFISDMNMDELSNRLMISVMNLKKNQLSLENYPYIVKGDMAVVAQLCVGEKNADGLYTSCLTVTHGLLDQWKISKDSLFMMALKNGVKLMKPCLEQIGGVKSDDSALPVSFVLTNHYHFNGASSIFYDNSLLANIGHKVILLPVNSNEVYLVSEVDKNDDREFIQSIDELYQEFCAQYGDGLCDHVLLYDFTKPNILTDSEGKSFYVDLNDNREVNTESMDSGISVSTMTR